MSESETLFKGRFLELRRDRHWEYAVRVNARGAAMVLALTPAREMVLVEQYRVPLHARCIELPAGLIGDVAGLDEAADATALRELEEETGYIGARAEPLTAGPISPGMSSELIELFLVRDARRVSVGGGAAHEGEDIAVHVVPLERVHDFLQAQAAAGKLIEPRIYAGLWFAERTVG
ncbi:MAG: NUDIX hydrolase [Gammaproteobacteria bacterium]|nr:NUDIX hydrolase [Gammaproteobacteria bacterium]